MKHINYDPLSQKIPTLQVLALVGKATVWQKANIYLGAMFFILATIGISLVLALGNPPDTGAMLFFALFGVMGIYVFADALSQLQAATQIWEFARANGFGYVRSNSDHGLVGSVFGSGWSRIMVSIYEYEPNMFQIGNLQNIINSGGSSTKQVYGFIRLKLPRRLPHIVLVNRRHTLPHFAGLQKSQHLSLEGSFDKYFRLHAPKGYETDALYIFTPDIMELFMTQAPQFTCEIIDDELYLYSPKPLMLQSPEVMRVIMGLIAKISPKLNRQVDYYADTNVGNRAINLIATPGQRLAHMPRIVFWLLALSLVSIGVTALIFATPVL